MDTDTTVTCFPDGDFSSSEEWNIVLYNPATVPQKYHFIDVQGGYDYKV